MNKTREQWARIDPKFCAENNSAAATTFLLADAKDDIEALFRQRDALLAALERTVARPLTGNPTHAELVEHWQYEQEQGNGMAADQLFALAAIAAAKGGAV